MSNLSQYIIDKLRVEITDENLEYWNRAYLESREYAITDTLEMHVWHEATETSNPVLYFALGMPAVEINIGTTVDKCIELIEDAFDALITTSIKDEDPTDILYDCFEKMNPNTDYNVYVPFLKGTEIKQVARDAYIIKDHTGAHMVSSLMVDEIDDELVIYKTLISKIKWVDVMNFLHAKGNDE